MSTLVTKATPAPGIAKLRVEKDAWKGWSKHLRLIRTCQHCGITYRSAGAAWVCEHYHEGGF